MILYSLYKLIYFVYRIPFSIHIHSAFTALTSTNIVFDISWFFSINSPCTIQTTPCWAMEPVARPGIQRCTTWHIRNLRWGRVARPVTVSQMWSGRAWHCQVAFKCTSIGPSDECDQFCFVSHPLLSKNFGEDQSWVTPNWRAWFEITSRGSNELLHEQQMLRQHKGFAQLVIAHGAFSHSIAIDVTKD